MDGDGQPPASNGDSKLRSRAGFSLTNWRSSSRTLLQGERAGEDVSRRLLSVVNHQERTDSGASPTSKSLEVTAGLDGTRATTTMTTSTPPCLDKAMAESTGPAGAPQPSESEERVFADHFSRDSSAPCCSQGSTSSRCECLGVRRVLQPSRNGSSHLGLGLYIHIVTSGEWCRGKGKYDLAKLQIRVVLLWMPQ